MPKKTIAELEAENASLLETIKALTEKSAAQEEVIDEMNATINSLSTQTTTKADALEVEHDGKTYAIAVPSFRLSGQVHKAKELMANPKLVLDVLAIEGQSILIPNS